MVGVFTGICCGLAVGLGLYYGLPPRVENPPITPVKPPGERVFDNAAVAADSGMCSTIGKDILKADGSVVDASIAAMLCVGLANSHRYHLILCFQVFNLIRYLALESVEATLMFFSMQKNRKPIT